MNNRNAQAFTLIELMVVVAILGILAAITVPSYLDHVVKTRRNNASIALTDLAARMERAYANNNTYAGNTVTGLGAPTTVADDLYTLSIESADTTSFEIRATPTGAQASSDAACAALTLDHTGSQGITGTGTAGECWK